MQKTQLGKPVIEKRVREKRSGENMICGKTVVGNIDFGKKQNWRKIDLGNMLENRCILMVFVIQNRSRARYKSCYCVVFPIQEITAIGKLI